MRFEVFAGKTLFCGGQSKTRLLDGHLVSQVLKQPEPALRVVNLIQIGYHIIRQEYSASIEPVSDPPFRAGEPEHEIVADVSLCAERDIEMFASDLERNPQEPRLRERKHIVFSPTRTIDAPRDTYSPALIGQGLSLQELENRRIACQADLCMLIKDSEIAKKWGDERHIAQLAAFENQNLCLARRRRPAIPAN